jgi:hypothetical protein
MQQLISGNGVALPFGANGNGAIRIERFNGVGLAIGLLPLPMIAGEPEAIALPKL